MYIALVTLLFTLGCKQKVTNNGGNHPKQNNTEAEITITVKGDAGLEVKKPDTFKVKKDSTWKDIKATATSKIAPKENQEIKEWRLGEAKGTVLKDTEKFEKDAVVFAVHKENINLTIEADEGYTFKDATKPCKIKIEKGSTWAVVKEKAEMKVELKADYTATGWKLSNKDGQSLEDAYIFNNDSIIYATSKKNEITITVAGDEGVNLLEKKTFGADKGATWGNIKEEAVAIATAKEDFEIKEWHRMSADGELLKDESKFEESETVFAVTKRKIVKYKVEHWQENADDDEYSKVNKDTEEKTGEAGKNTDAKAKSYEGFTAQSFTQSLVKADGTTVIEIRYNRKITSLILNLDGGETEPKLEDGKDGNKLLKGKYGAKVEVKGLKKENYGFEKWEPALPATFPIKNKTMKRTHIKPSGHETLLLSQ